MSVWTRVHPHKGAIERLYTSPPAGSIVACLDEMGPIASKSYPGQRVVRPAAPSQSGPSYARKWVMAG